MYEAFEQFWGDGVPLACKGSTDDVNLLRELVEEFYFCGRMGVHMFHTIEKASLNS